MKIIITKDYEELSVRAAQVMLETVKGNPYAVLGLATGTTPLGLYAHMIADHEKCGTSYAHIRTVNLDEYAGLAPEHSQSYRRFMQENFFDHINIPRENTHVPNGLAPDLEAECRRYNQVIQSLGGIDIQLLGMGHNGHIGFNEPGQAFELETHVVDLTDNTIDANARFFASRDEVPRQAITMGIKSIMQARHILVVVSGTDKAEIVKKAFFGPVTPKVPASILQMHPHVSLVADEAALSLL